ncbi:cyclase [Maricaulis sp. W15]|uniref:cyclase family protein n=1 Tax=Maricaulis sp. W15 TaxID=1772333 RepID=UPI000948F17F|nr:cyclase family protein [Maricaulis sp. W15]OLF78291.1 cyclase [Maricaulis sp. W15]
MPRFLHLDRVAIPALLALVATSVGQAQQVGHSPWGADDEIGRLNDMTDASRAAILGRIKGGTSYDLAVEYFIGMPSWQAAGDPHYRLWMTHTPRGTAIDDPLGVGDGVNAHVSYSGSAVSLYTHTGTHIDALSHFGIDGRIWNGFTADEHLGDRGWQRADAGALPPIIARGLLVDLPALFDIDRLEPGYRVTATDIAAALDDTGLTIRTGDVVLIRTGWMQDFEDAETYMTNAPGLGMDAARYLADAGAMVVGADNLSFEAFPSEVEGNYVPVHTFLLAQSGIPILEVVNLEGLARDGVHEFAFIAASLRLRGADAAPMRPIALPVE